MIIKRPIGIVDALQSLVPNSKWTVGNNNYKELCWLDEEKSCPSEEEIEQEIIKLQQEYENLKYQILREKEYPDFTEYLDGIVKGDQEQIQNYINKCLAVKAKYPKYEEKS